ncbi:hypothetical protein HT051_07675 [Methyloligella sp. GL2]|uniref:hypothetical protein n=2 Tax=unclassified Methyloligella TaxID=2625955 RepID=UPI00157C30B2|nr:hypothetical protein [Methyloligella sp. GL2]QKP77343.1 hypothetical protein HT051_07675 [Methyloligella sp. GL2]
MTALVALAGPASAAGPILVTNGEDSGEGSLRAALEQLSKDDAPGQIFLVTKDDIKIESGLTYGGKAPLAIFGQGQTVKSSADETVLTLSEGADLTVSDLNFSGPDNFDIKHRGKDGKGIFIDVRDDQTGTVSLKLDKVKVSGVSYHGIHVSDCNLADDCGSGRGGAGGGSPASIDIHLTEVTIEDAGNGRFDADGLRVDERGPGDIRFYAQGSTFTDVGADGVELDEGQEGSVVATAVDSKFDENGAYCDPKILDAFMPEEDEGEFEDEEKVTEADIPAAVKGSPDDACFEREVELYDSGNVKEFEIGIDTDDGFDIDEAGPGDLMALIIGASVRKNLDEGIDFGEENEGDAKVAIWRTTTKDNHDDGIKIVESEDGSLQSLLEDVTSKDNGGNGAAYKEYDAGNLDVMVSDSKTADNDDGDQTGLKLTKYDGGEGTLTVRDSEIEDGIKAKNVKVVED